MSKTIRGYKCPGIPCLAPALRQWIKLTEDVAEEWDVLPWVNTERAVLSMFAGAIWRARGKLFEEFADDKHTYSRRSGRFRRYQGRVDLYFRISRRRFIAEAKQVLSGCTAEDANPVPKILKRLTRARQDIRKSRPLGEKRLAIVFAIPYMRRGAKKIIDNRVTTWVRKVSSIDCDAIAWVFPARSRLALPGDDYCNPGIAVIIEKVT